MRAAVLLAPERLAVTDVAEPAADGQAIVALERAGICGTDVSILRGKIPVAYPRVLGHELVGRVVQPASGDGSAAGTRVLVNPSIACGRCHACRRDLEHLCPHGALIGRDADGGFAERIAVDEARLLPVPEAVSSESASLLQVLGTCVHAQRTFTVFPGQVAVVVGLGVSGQLMVQLLRRRGLDKVIGVTRSAPKRRLAERLGASCTVPPQDAAAAVADLTAGAGADVVIEAVGSVPTLAQSIELAGLAATVVMFGTIGGAAAPDLPFYQLYYKELRLENPRAARTRDYATAIDLAAAGALDLAPLWSAGFPLEDAATAFSAVAEAGTLKVTIDIA